MGWDFVDLNWVNQFLGRGGLDLIEFGDLCSGKLGVDRLVAAAPDLISCSKNGIGVSLFGHLKSGFLWVWEIC